MSDWLLYQQYLSVSAAFGVDINKMSMMMRQFLERGTPLYNVVLKVKVSSDSGDDGADKPEKANNFELNDEELKSVFSRFGDITAVETQVQHDCGYVTFKHLISAVVALLTYHKWYLPQNDAETLARYGMVFKERTPEELFLGVSSQTRKVFLQLRDVIFGSAS